MTITLEENTVIKTVYGEWVQVVSQFDNMVTVDRVAQSARFERRSVVHISKLMLPTAHKLSKKLS